MVMLCLFYRNMRYGSFKGKQKESVPGRKLIIAIVIFTSALSFTLGYFVGKAVLKENQPLGIESQRQIIAIPPQQETAPALQKQQVQDKEQPIADNPQPPVNPDSLESSKSLNSLKGVPVKTAAAKEENNPSRPVQNAVIYTVQAGAFKNLKDAETLKHKLESKGYKAYIKKSAAAKGIKIFKVRTGEFMNKKDAEAVALKLKKAEGLKAFVTLKTSEKEEVRNGK